MPLRVGGIDAPLAGEVGAAALPAGPKPGASRLGAVAAALGAASLAAGGAAGGAAPAARKTQFVPKVPTERPRAAAREAGGARGAVAAADASGADRQLQALIRQTKEDAARVEARTLAGRGRGRGGPADRGRFGAAAPAAVTFGGVIAPRVAPGAQGDDKAGRRTRTPREKDEPSRAGPLPIPMDVDDDEDDEDGALGGWLDLERYYPTVLPFPAVDHHAAGDTPVSPLADLGLASGTPDGRLLLMQMPVRAVSERVLRAAARAAVRSDPPPAFTVVAESRCVCIPAHVCARVCVCACARPPFRRRCSPSLGPPAPRAAPQPGEACRNRWRRFRTGCWGSCLCTPAAR
jgi:hypothetical protein